MNQGDEIQQEDLHMAQPDPGSLADLDNRPHSPEPDNPQNEDNPATLEDLQIIQGFIEAIQGASLDNDKLPEDVIDRLQNPEKEVFNLDDQEELRTGIELYLDTETASEEVFNKARETFHRSLDRKGVEYDRIPSLFQVKEHIKEITGVYPIKEDMCPQTCIGYTGIFSDLDACPKCNSPCYNLQELAASGGRKKIPLRQFLTLPLGPQLQTHWRTPEGARDMRYRSKLTKDIFDQAKAHADQKIVIKTYKDIFHVQDGKITENDMLYQSKQSDCWIYIWVILDLAPDLRYKKCYIFPGGFIPGPNKPQNIESFLFPGFHHIAALSKEGLAIWDALENRSFISYLFILLGLADGPGLTYLNGLTGHSGAFGKEGATHYYPALLKPLNYSVDGCDHDDVDGSHLPIGNIEEYQKAVQIAEHQHNRKSTGITRPSIFILAVPHCFGGDLMHLISLNILDLLLDLWRGNLECDPTDDKNTWQWLVLVGDVWKNHGTRVVDTTPYLPGSFDRPPRNPAEKISSGYKAWEFLTYIFGLGPGLLHGILPNKYWKNYCKLVAGVRLLHQHSITKEQLVHGHKLLISFETEFEEIYYQHKASCLHFCHKSIHALLHIGPEVPRLGPGSGYTQWPMERTIGNLGEEIRQPSQPFANLAERGARRAQVNSLLALLPDLTPNKLLSHLSQDLGGGYILSMGDSCSRTISEVEKQAIHSFYQLQNIEITQAFDIRKFARLQLPNLQFVQTAWKETTKPLKKVRMSRNVMLKTLALVSIYGTPDPILLEESSGVLAVCQYKGIAALEVVAVKQIASCIAMVPFKEPGDRRYFVCEKMGLDIAFLAGSQEVDL
ncbi:hypothetical protein BYT27DRAFT_7221332 [Phlegmacium glaucopus]|nr:hypothetical protein BYT27DRAFT_7221332 [Phlegmacium glaucopus]